MQEYVFSVEYNLEDNKMIYYATFVLATTQK